MWLRLREDLVINTDLIWSITKEDYVGRWDINFQGPTQYRQWSVEYWESKEDRDRDFDKIANILCERVENADILKE